MPSELTRQIKNKKKNSERRNSKWEEHYRQFKAQEMKPDEITRTWLWRGYLKRETDIFINRQDALK